jgi:D-alanyl-D-alanine carboxypeptidase
VIQPGSTLRHGPIARAALAILAAAIVAACGNGSPTPSPSATPVATPTASPIPTASPTPALASIVPVPTSRLAAPSEPAAHLDDATARALQAALDGVRSGDFYPGMSAAIVFPDGSTWTGVSGTAVLSSATKVTPDTLFAVASISKTFLAALVCRLAEAGTIGLDDHLDKYVPDYPNAANITIRELLNHTSGIPDLFQDLGPAIAAHPTATWTPQQVLAGIASKPWCAPGKCYHYSNTDYVLLGLVVETATGQTLAKLVRDDFLTPLGLSHTFLQTEEPVEGPEAHGYLGTGSNPVDDTAGTMIPYTSEVTAVGAAGAYVSTAQDLAIWGNALYGGDVLDQASLSDMVDISSTQPYRARSVFGYSVTGGLGMEETTVAGHLAWGHLGSLDGFLSELAYFPDYRVTVVVLINANWANPLSATSALARVVFG